MPPQLQQYDAMGLAGRLRQVLGAPDTSGWPPAGLRVESLPGLYCQVAASGEILAVSQTLATTLGADDPEQLRGRLIGSYLPALAFDSALIHEIRDKGAICDVPVRLVLTHCKSECTALLSARTDSGNVVTPGMWTACLVLLSPEEQGAFLPAGIDWDLLYRTQSELQAQIERLAQQFPPTSAGQNAPSLRSSMRMFSMLLPRVEALLALSSAPVYGSFDTRALVANQCRASGRLLQSTGVDLVFDAEPSIPERLSICERRLTTCLGLLLGSLASTEDVDEILVRMALDDRRFLKLELSTSPATTENARSAEQIRQVELANTLAATVDGTVSIEAAASGYRQYTLRVGLRGLDTTAAPAGESKAVPHDPALQALRVLIVTPGQLRGNVMASWIKRQHAEVTVCGNPADTLRACRGIRPDIAIVDLPECLELPEFLRDVPALALRSPLNLPPDWCQASIEKPVFEEDLLNAVCSLLPRFDLEQWHREDAADTGAARVLAVDDNLVNQRLIQGMLVRMGYEVDLAANGLEALVAIRTRAYDAVLMDWEMPVMDGMETTEAIRQFPEPLSKLPIIAVTAHALPGDRESCLSSGMNDYLSKPVKVDLLRTLLDKWLPCSPRRTRREG